MSKMDMPTKQEVADAVVVHTCTRNCMGVENNTTGCCTMYDRDYIIGPIPDSDALLKRYQETFDPDAKREDLFVEYDEGKTLFPDLECWQSPANFPALRVDMESPAHPCKFLGDDNLCTMHAIRSETCRNYTCGYVSDMLERLSLTGAQS